MNNTDYQDMPCISSHWLIDMLTSPAHCWRRHLDPYRVIDGATDAIRMGTLVHNLALTPGQFDKEIRVLDVNRMTRVGRAEWNWTLAQGWTPVTPKELDKARAIVAALKADKTANRLLTYGRKERTIIQPRPAGLLPLKARIDVHHEARRHVVELKTTWNLDGIEHAMKKYRYPLSAAFYRDMVRGQHMTFVFVQSTAPHKLAIFDLSRSDLQDGEMMYSAALDMFDACWKHNEWPDLDSHAPAEDDDPLMLPDTPTFHRGGPRFDMPVGELAL